MESMLFKYRELVESGYSEKIKAIALADYPAEMKSVLSPIFDDLVCIATTGETCAMLEGPTRQNLDRNQYACDAFLRIKAVTSGNTDQEIEAHALEIFKSVMLLAIRTPSKGYPISIISPDALRPVLQFKPSLSHSR